MNVSNNVARITNTCLKFLIFCLTFSEMAKTKILLTGSTGYV